MKLVFYNRESYIKNSVYDSLNNVSVVGKDIIFDKGAFHSVDCPYLLLEDDAEIPDFLIDDQIAEQKNKDLLANQQIKIDEFSNICETKISNGFTSATTGYFYRFNDKDQANFTQRLLTIVAIGKDNYTEEIWWRTGVEDDGVYILHTTDQFLTICTEADTYKTDNMKRYSYLKEVVKQCTNKDDIDKITWDYQENQNDTQSGDANVSTV